MAENKVKVEAKEKPKLKVDPSEKPVLTWEVSEFHPYEKGGGWMMIIVVGVLVLGTAFYFLKNWTGMGLVVAAGLALFSQGRATPKNIRCSLFQGGVVVKDKPYNFSDLKSFWLFMSPAPLIRFEKVSCFSMPITVPLGKTDPEQVRLFLSKRLPEHDDRGEDVSDRISRWFRF